MTARLAPALIVGEHVRLGRSIYIVTLVNVCRARLQLVEGPGQRRHVEIKDEAGEIVREFDATKHDDPRVLDVSPRSIVERVS
jgi:hypothetical protein